MARYIKVNYKVAEFLNLGKVRNRLMDGNYLLWQADMLAFGKLPQLAEILDRIGGIALLPHEARQEQDGSVLRKLPAATDKRFVIPIPVDGEAADEEESTGGSEGTAAGEESTASEDESSGEGENTSGGSGTAIAGGNGDTSETTKSE